MRTETQRSAILGHLMTLKTITPMQALDLYKCFRLAAHIKVLRDRGYLISTNMMKGNDGSSYAQYQYLGEVK